MHRKCIKVFELPPPPTHKQVLWHNACCSVGTYTKIFNLFIFSIVLGHNNNVKDLINYLYIAPLEHTHLFKKKKVLIKMMATFITKIIRFWNVTFIIVEECYNHSWRKVTNFGPQLVCLINSTCLVWYNYIWMHKKTNF